MEPTDKDKGKGKAEKPKADIWGSLLNSVLKNPFIWGMALTYFFIYVVRQVRPRVQRRQRRLGAMGISCKGGRCARAQRNGPGRLPSLGVAPVV